MRFFRTIVLAIWTSSFAMAGESTIIPPSTDPVTDFRALAARRDAPADLPVFPVGLDARTRSTLTSQYPDARFAWKEPSVASRASDGILSSTEIRPGILRVNYEKPATAEAGPMRVTEDWPFSALRTAWIAKRRIRPAEPLSREDFGVEEIDLTDPMIHEVRGIILPATSELEKFETRVTILEGQFPINSGVQKIPAVKRGETVRLILSSGDLELSVSGVVQEPAQIGGTLRVLTSATKREVSGVLREGRIVEVRL